MGKRANGEGTISRRKDKSGKTVSWRAAVTVGMKPDGTPDRVWVSGKTQDEAREGMQRVVSDLQRGTLAKTDGLTVAQYLDQWLDHKRGQLKPKSVDDYARSIEKRLKPALGRLQLDKLRALDIEQMLRKVGAGVSASEARRTRTILGLALGQAVKWQMLPRNLVAVVDAPKVEKKEMKVWEPGQVARFLAHVQPHRLYALFHLALITGMRCGELQGLRWQDVDFDKAALQVRQTATEIQGKLSFGPPKSRASRRSIHLSPSTVDVLRAHHARQQAERDALGAGWQDSGLVFVSELGTPLINSNIRRLFLTLSGQADLPPSGFTTCGTRRPRL